MIFRVLLVFLAWLLTACNETGMGPVYPTPEQLPEWVVSADAVDPRSDRAPVVDDPLVTFRLGPGDRRSALRAGQDWRLTNRYLFGFDVRLARGALAGQRVTLARLKRLGSREEELVSVEADTRRGVTIFGRTCIPAAELGNWHKVEIRIRLADDDTGFLEVFCDRRPIWAETGMRTTKPPVCRRREGCTTPVPHPVRVEWQLGLLADSGARRGIEVQMRRIYHRLLFVIQNRVGTL